MTSFALLTGCIKNDVHLHSELRIAVSPWIGYSPLYYAHEKGWLKEVDIDLVYSTSLNETVHYFKADLIDAFVSTQYESSILDKKNLLHLMALDRSDGGDVILSNKPLETILKSKKVKAYLEMDTVNELLLEGFLKKYSLSISNIELINKNQLSLNNIKADDKDDIIIITYEPYASMLRENNFHDIASTKDSDMLVLDSLYVNKEAMDVHCKQVNSLKVVIKKAFKNLKDNPREYYDTIKHNLGNQSYLEFSQSLLKIEWLINKENKEINNLIKSHDISTIVESTCQ